MLRNTKAWFAVAAVGVGLAVLAPAAEAQHRKGDRVECNWKGKGKYYPATIIASASQKVSIKYDDGSDEVAAATRCRAFRPDTRAVRAGARVECNWKGKGKLYRAVVESRSGDTVQLKYDDGSRETSPADRCVALGGGAAKPAPVAPTPAPVAAALAVGTRVECNWKGRGKFYPGTVRTSSGNNVNIDYDDGDKEATVASRCRVIARAAGSGSTSTGSTGTRTTGTTTSSTSTGSTSTGSTSTGSTSTGGTGGSSAGSGSVSSRGSGTATPAPPAGVKPLDDFFAEAARRMKPHPAGRGLLIDPLVPGEYIRLGVTHGRVTTLQHNIAKFEKDGSGLLTIQHFGLNAREQLVRDDSLEQRVPFVWATERPNIDGSPAAVMRMSFQDSTQITFVYARQGTTMGAIFFDEQTNFVGEQMLFRGRAEFIADWNANNHKLRDALINAKRTQEKIDLMQLQTRTMRMGNDNLLMLKTMNFGMTGSATF